MDIEEWLRKEARAEMTVGCSCASRAEVVGAELQEKSSNWAHAKVKLNSSETTDREWCRCQEWSYLGLEAAVPAAHTLQMSGGSNTSSCWRASAGTSWLDVDVNMVLMALSPEVASTIGINMSRKAG